MTIKGKGAAQIKLQAAGIDAICAEISAGANLADICKKYNVGFGALAGFLSAPDHIELYARARESKIELMVDDMMQIADSITGDTQRDRLRVDTRKWLASKILPKKYGDRVALAGDSADPLTINIVRYGDGDDKPAE